MRGPYVKRTYRLWTWEQKRAAVARMESTKAAVIASELGVDRRVLYTWREHVRRLDQKAHRERSRERALERENRELKQALATKVLEADFLQGVLRRIETRRQPVSGSGETAFTSRSK
ncbi:MAG TPA: transposase [Acidobacteriaceae bacterium]